MANVVVAMYRSADTIITHVIDSTLQYCNCHVMPNDEEWFENGATSAYSKLSVNVDEPLSQTPYVRWSLPYVQPSPPSWLMSRQPYYNTEIRTHLIIIKNNNKNQECLRCWHHSRTTASDHSVHLMNAEQCQAQGGKSQFKSRLANLKSLSCRSQILQSKFQP